MVDYKKYYEKLQNRIGETMSADKILEESWWNVVVRELNLISYYCARDIQLQKGILCEKKYVTGVIILPAIRGMASDATYGSDINSELLARERESISRLGRGIELDPRCICIRKVGL
jgi:hypothetical protein